MFDGISMEAARTFRYAEPEMASLWSDTTKWHLWQLVAASSAAARGGDQKLVSLIEFARTPKTAEIVEAEATTRHDVVAYNQVLRESIMTTKFTPEPGEGERKAAAGLVHRGMTSSDLVDSANAIRWWTAAKLIGEAGRELVKALAKAAEQHRATDCVERTHGQWAEITTWGRVAARYGWEIDQQVDRLMEIQRWSLGEVKLSGPIGDHKSITEAEEDLFADLLGARTNTRMRAAVVSTQVVSRTGLLALADACKGLMGAIAGLALEVRLRSQSGVAEITEGFASGQRGSSSMPHKTNPVVSEQLCGLNGVVKGLVNGLDNAFPLWGARDISHSSVERVTVPQITTITHYAAKAATRLVERLEVNRFQMLANLDEAETETSTAAALNWLTAHGVDREAAWELVRATAKEVESNGGRLDTKLPVVARKLRSAGTAELNWASLRLDAVRPGPDTKLWTWVKTKTL